jgi:hypothetical protein
MSLIPGTQPIGVPLFMIGARLGLIALNPNLLGSAKSISEIIQEDGAGGHH